MSSYQRMLVSRAERDARAGANKINRCDSLGWAPDRVWSDEVLCSLIAFYVYSFNTTA
jgi:hypothetical protein